MRPVLAFSLVTLSGIGTAMPFLIPEAYLLGWVALVPLLFSLDQRSLGQSYCLSLVFGLSLYASASYWIVDFLLLFKDYSMEQSLLMAGMFWLYCAQLPALALLLWQWIRQRTSIPDWFSFPVVMMAFYAHFPMLFSIQLGAGQSQFLPALQGLDLVGVYGLDVLLCVVNLVIFRTLAGYRWHHYSRYYAATLLLVLLWFGYGTWQLSQWRQAQSDWPTRNVAVIQPNESPILGRPPYVPGYSLAYPVEMAMTEALPPQDLIIWPETRFKKYFDNPIVQTAYHQQIKQLGSPVLLQDLRNEADSQTFNSARLINANGEPIGQYDKMKRVAFGEYLPLVEQQPKLKRWLESYLGDLLDDISRGSGPQPFQLNDLSLVPLICYEVMFPLFVTQSLPSNNANTLISVQSSNGWFGDTRQPWQHVLAGSLRAVENRLPMVHAVNNGPSLVSLPSGDSQIIGGFHRTGAFSATVPIPTTHQPTLFHRLPYLLPLGLPLLLLLWIIVTFRRP